MAELYAQTIKYFRLAIEEFLPALYELEKATTGSEKEEIEDLIEAYEDIVKKIDAFGLNLEDPNRHYDGEPDDIEIGLSDEMISNLAQLSHRMLLSWKSRQSRLEQKKYLTDDNETELYKIKNLIWSLEALMNESSYIVGKYSHLGPLRFPGENSEQDSLDNPINELISEIDSTYSLGDQDLLEAKKLGEVESKVVSGIGALIENLNDEIFSLKFKKLSSGVRNQLKSGFHNRKTAETKLEKWKKLLLEIRDFELNGTDTTHDAVETIKNKFKSEGLFVETRSQGEDLNLLIGKRDGSPDKAHVFIDEKTGEIRVEDNQQEPTELVSKIEAILTLPDGRKIKTTREAIEDLGNDSKK